MTLARERVFARKSVFHDLDGSVDANECARCAMESGRAALGLADLIDITSSCERSPGNDLVAQQAARKTAPPLAGAEQFVSDWPRGQTQIVDQRI
jgi:hypothetical protein